VNCPKCNKPMKQMVLTQLTHMCVFFTLVLAVTGLFWKFYVPRSAFAGNSAFVQRVVGIGHDAFNPTPEQHSPTKLLAPVNAVSVREQHLAFNVETQRIAGVQTLLFFVQQKANTMDEWIARSEQSYRHFIIHRFPVDFSDDSMQREGQTGWIDNIEEYLKRVRSAEPESPPILHVYPLFLFQLAQSERILRYMRTDLCGVGRLFACCSILFSKLKLFSISFIRSSPFPYPFEQLRQSIVFMKGFGGFRDCKLFGSDVGLFSADFRLFITDLPLEIGQNSESKSEQSNQDGTDSGPPIGRRFAFALFSEFLLIPGCYFGTKLIDRRRKLLGCFVIAGSFLIFFVALALVCAIGWSGSWGWWL
jgi:hypothetical protein